MVDLEGPLQLNLSALSDDQGRSFRLRRFGRIGAKLQGTRGALLDLVRDCLCSGVVPFQLGLPQCSQRLTGVNVHAQAPIKARLNGAALPDLGALGLALVGAPVKAHLGVGAVAVGAVLTLAATAEIVVLPRLAGQGLSLEGQGDGLLAGDFQGTVGQHGDGDGI